MRRLRGNILYSAVLVLGLFALVFAGQTVVYQAEIRAKQAIIQEDKALVLYNLARQNNIANQVQLKFNIGTVERQGDKYLVTLKNKRRFTYTVPQ